MACICLFLFSGKGNKMNIVRRIGAVLLSLLMIVGITTQSVSAASYKMEWHGKSTAYGSTVGNFTIDGRRAWCIEPVIFIQAQNLNMRTYVRLCIMDGLVIRHGMV